MVDIVLVRHGARDPGEVSGSLSKRGRHQTRVLARALKHRGVAPEIVVTSRSEHAKETATLLSGALGQAAGIVEVDALTPAGGPGGIDELFSQVESAVGDRLKSAACVLLVGHEGRLSDLVTELTGARFRPLDHGGAVCIRGLDLPELASGRGSLWHRYPTVDHLEEAIRAKVHSKMTVATFLAGFVFTALSGLLLEERSWPWHRLVATASLTASLTLFVASVYIYDQLGTPSGFWTDARRPRAVWRRLNDHRESREQARWTKLSKAEPGEDQDAKARLADEDATIYRPRHDGPVYWLMVDTSRLVFTPAVVLALVGFVALLVGTEDWRIWSIGLAGLVVAGGYAALRRPNLAAD